MKQIITFPLGNYPLVIETKQIYPENLRLTSEPILTVQHLIPHEIIKRLNEIIIELNELSGLMTNSGLLEAISFLEKLKESRSINALLEIEKSAKEPPIEHK